MSLTATKFFALSSDAIDAATESSFYGRLKMRNGTFKLTRSARFPDVENAISPILSLRAKDIHTVLDVGVSTGVTTVEFTDFLRALGATPQVIGTDLFVEGHIVEPFKGCRVLTDQDGWPLEYDFFGTPVRAWIARRDYFTGLALVLSFARRTLRGRLQEMVRSGKSKDVKFLTGRLVNRDDISISADDVFTRSESFLRRFDLVRAANVLNRSYFSDHDIGRAVSNIREYLRPGGMLLVTRTDSNRCNTGTLFELSKDRQFSALVRVGGGSETEQIVL